MTKPVFSSRTAMMLVMLGMAVGTGNIWRFPRIAASNGGGSFLVAWVVFLLLWSVPLILVEFAAGKASRTGPIGAFAKLAGSGNSWMGAWVAFVSTAIMFYYSVVMGWTLRYLFGAVTGTVPTTACDGAAAGCVGREAGDVGYSALYELAGSRARFRCSRSVGAPACGSMLPPEQEKQILELTQIPGCLLRKSLHERFAGVHARLDCF